MNEQDAQFEYWRELASLPPGDPNRRELHDRLPMMDPAERETWLGIMKESDWLESELKRVEIPAGLEAELLSIGARRGSRQTWWHPELLGIVTWRQAAALFFVIGTLTYLWWPNAQAATAAAMRHPQQLNGTLAAQIADWAAGNHERQSLQIKTDDRQAVTTALKNKNLPFSVSLLEPTTSLQLEGGGICRFGSTPVAFTRWKSGDETYSLYQFDGSTLGLPTNFAETQETPADDHQLTVHIWPGDGNCSWALVTEYGQAAQSVFGGAE